MDRTPETLLEAITLLCGTGPGRVTTNRIENSWSCVKRTFNGTYAVRPFHLDAYLDEQVFWVNARDDNDAGRFRTTLKGADGKRLTPADLTTGRARWRRSAPIGDPSASTHE